MRDSEPREGQRAPSLERQAVALAGQVAMQMHVRLRNYFQLDELKSLALTPALLAAREWDGRGSFAKFTVQRIRWALLTELRRERRQTRLLSRAGYHKLVAVTVERAADLTAVTDDDAADPPPAADVLAAMIRNAATAVTVELDASGMLPDPHENVETNVERMRLRRAVAALPEAERMVIEQHGYHGATFEEIATASGVERSTLYSRYTRALDRLRVSFEETAHDSG